MTKIKVLHYLNSLDLGGTSKTCQLFFEHSSPGFESTVVFKKDGNHPRLEQFEMAAKVCRGNLASIDDPTQLDNIIRSNGIDIVHVYRSGFSEYPEPGLHIHPPHFVETNVFGHVDPNPRIDRTLYMSKWLMDYSLSTGVGQRFPASRFDYVNNPVETPTCGDILPFEIPENAIVLGRCGRPDNGIYNDVNVRAARLLRMQGYPIHFIVAAPPSNMIDDLGKWDIPFHIVPPTTNPQVLSQFYNTVDIYAHARADGETFGVNIAEAMMHGKPVVTHWATPSFPGMGVFQSQTELVDNDVTGFVVENDAAYYAEALKKLIDDLGLRVNMGMAGLRKAKNEYHASVCVRKLEQIYRDVMTNG